MTEIEQSLKEEIREKKKIGNSVHKKKGRRGYVGAMRTPSDLMSGKEKRAYTQPSPVTTSNIYYDKIMNLDEFKALSRQKKMLVLDAYKRKYKVSEIAAEWNLSAASIYKYFKSYLTAPIPEKQNPTPSQTNANASAEPARAALSAEQESECSFMLVGDFEAPSLSRKLNGLAYMLNDQLRYEVEIRVREIPS